METIRQTDNYEISTEGDLVDLRYQSSTGKVGLQFDEVRYSVTGFVLLIDGKSLAELYQEWDGDWYFVLSTDNVETEVRIPKELAMSSLDLANKSAEAQKEFRMAQKENE